MRRYSILFIDDEELIRESFLRLVDWEKHHFDVAGVFKNGEAAWEYLSANPVDIIVTDINMPFMTGIDLLERVRNSCAKTRVLLLTGYEYFEYAQKAIQLKAFDFLLKPVTTESLLHAVKKAALDIEREEETEEAVGKNLELSQGYFINQVLRGKIELKEMEKRARELRLPVKGGSWLVLVMAIDGAEGKQIPEGEAEEVKKNLQDRIREMKIQAEAELGIRLQIYFARNISLSIQMALAAEKNGLTTDAFSGFMEQLISVEREQSGCHFTLAAGRCCRQLQELSESFQRVMDVLNKRHILGVGRILRVTDFAEKPMAADTIVLPTDTLLRHIRMGMTQEVKQDVKSIYESLRHRKYLTLESVRMVTTELAITAFKGEASSKDEAVSYLYYLNHIQQLNTLAEMEEDITQFAVRIAEQRKSGGSHKKKIAQQALEYLQNNYGNEHLSLNDVAEHLSISVPYLAVLFKQETGRNFGVHLLEIRMEKAKELLRTTGLTVGEIAEQVGYSSSQYFGVCFKKYTSLSPGAYREQR